MTDETVYKAEERQKLARQHNWPAYIIIGFGVLILGSNLFDFDMIDVLWPGFIIAPGLMLLWPAYNSTPDHQSRLSFLAIPGAVLVTIGLLNFMMNLTDHFEAWAYSWTLLLAAVAWAVMYIRRFDTENKVHESGHKFIKTMIMMLGGLFVLFELVIWSNFHPLLAVALIGYCVYLLANKRKETATS
jgi:hypothetical protein